MRHVFAHAVHAYVTVKFYLLSKIFHLLTDFLVKYFSASMNKLDMDKVTHTTRARIQTFREKKNRYSNQVH